MSGLGIFLLIVIFIWLIWPVIARWLKRKAMEKAEDYMRSSMGMPPRDKKKKNSNTRQPHDDYYRNHRNPYGNHNSSQEPLIPKEYAEDVEFTEVKDHSQSETHIHDHHGREIYHESQISDVEFTEIKKPRSK